MTSDSRTRRISTSDPIGEVVKRIGWDGLAKAFRESFIMSTEPIPKPIMAQHGQVGPATRNLTIIWEEEKRDLIDRIKHCESRLTFLEAWAQQWANGFPASASPTAEEESRQASR